eukprot:g14843.t1
MKYNGFELKDTTQVETSEGEVSPCGALSSFQLAGAGRRQFKSIVRFIFAAREEANRRKREAKGNSAEPRSSAGRKSSNLMSDDPTTREEPEEEAVQARPEDPEVKVASDALEGLMIGRIVSANIPKELGGNRTGRINTAVNQISNSNYQLTLCYLLPIIALPLMLTTRTVYYNYYRSPPDAHDRTVLCLCLHLSP